MNIGKLLTKSATNFPANLAIVQGSNRLDYAAFNARANQLAHALRRLGVQQGDNVSLLMYNRPEMLESMFACFKAGCAAVPINFRLHPNEFAYIIDHSASSAVLVSPEFNDALLEICPQIPRARHLIGVADSRDELLDYETLLAPESKDFADAEVDCLPARTRVVRGLGREHGLMISDRPPHLAQAKREAADRAQAVWLTALGFVRDRDERAHLYAAWEAWRVLEQARPLPF